MTTDEPQAGNLRRFYKKCAFTPWILVANRLLYRTKKWANKAVMLAAAPRPDGDGDANNVQCYQSIINPWILL